MAYWQWERANGATDRVLVCAHGVSRQGRDFDTLARAMQDGWRVVCPDVVGRGESDRLADPAAYQSPTYVADMVTLLARLDAEDRALVRHVDGRPDRHRRWRRCRARRSRVWSSNDVGPAIDPAGIARIGAYLGLPLTWASEDEAADYLLTISQGFGPHSREQWLALTRPMLRREGDRFRLHYDPAIGVPLRAITPAAAACRRGGALGRLRRDPLPDAASCAAPTPTSSSPATAAAMAARGPEGARARVRRRRPCADDRRCRPGRRRAGVPARRRVVVAPAAP